MQRVSKSRRQLLKFTAVVGATGLAGCVGSQGEEEFPSEQIRVIVSFGSGGGTDVYARKVWTKASEELDVDVQIENVPGSGGMRGAQELYDADPDGHTIAPFNVPGEPVTALVQEPGFEFTEFSGIASHAKNVLLLAADPNEGMEDFEDMAQRYRDGELEQFGGMQHGTQFHILANVIKNDEEYDVSWESYIPYDGSGPIAQALASGEIPVGVVTEPTAEDMGDQIEPFAVLSSQGSTAFPDLESPVDHGYPSIDYVGEVTRAFYAPPDTDDDVLATLDGTVQDAVESDELQSWADEAGIDLQYYGGPEFVDEATEEATGTIPDKVDLDDLDT